MTAQQTLHSPPARPTVSTDLGSLVQRLTAIPAGSHHILSCYVRLEPRDRTRVKYLITELKDRAKALRADPMIPGLGRDERLAIERDLSRILEYLSHARDLPHTPGLALFACEELGLFEAAPLRRVHRTRLMLDDTPWIGELVASEEGTQPILTVVIDRAHARFFEVTAAGGTEVACLVAGSTRGGKFHSDRGDAPGWGEHDYHRRLEQERHRHYANVVRQVEELLRTRPVRGIVLAGPADHTAALARFLPDRIADRLLGSAKLNPTAIGAAELQARSLGVAEEHGRKVLGSELKALDDAVGSGWAVSGARETLKALHRGQVRTLFIRDNLEGRGFRCSATGRLVLAKGDCRNEGQPQAVRDLVDEAIEEGLHQRVRVVIVPECEGAEAVDGLGATLRFR
jgi:peptide subunit release factor 1 (eRF1)